MKKTIIASLIVGVATFASVSLSSAQGYLHFANTDFGALNAPVSFAVDGLANGNGVTAGQAVGSEFSAGLIYSIDGGTTWLTDAAGAGYPTAFYATDGDSANGAGYFDGGSVALPQYVSGAVEIIIQAWTGGATYSDAMLNTAGGWIGQSSAFTLASVATGSNPVGYFPGGSLQAFTVNPVAIPEPTTLALAGLGGFGMLMALRRKKA